MMEAEIERKWGESGLAVERERERDLELPRWPSPNPEAESKLLHSLSLAIDDLALSTPPALSLSPPPDPSFRLSLLQISAVHFLHRFSPPFFRPENKTMRGGRNKSVEFPRATLIESGENIAAIEEGSNKLDEEVTATAITTDSSIASDVVMGNNSGGTMSSSQGMDGENIAPWYWFGASNYVLEGENKVLQRENIAWRKEEEERRNAVLVWNVAKHFESLIPALRTPCNNSPSPPTPPTPDQVQLLQQHGLNPLLGYVRFPRAIISSEVFRHFGEFCSEIAERFQICPVRERMDLPAIQSHSLSLIPLSLRKRDYEYEREYTYTSEKILEGLNLSPSPENAYYISLLLGLLDPYSSLPFLRYPHFHLYTPPYIHSLNTAAEEIITRLDAPQASGGGAGNKWGGNVTRVDEGGVSSTESGNNLKGGSGPGGEIIASEGVSGEEVRLPRIYFGKTSEEEDASRYLSLAIDSASTKDVDDAINFDTKTSTLFIHITDVSEIIPLSSRLSRLASERAISLYMPGEKWPMFPAEISEERMSLGAKNAEEGAQNTLTFALRFDPSTGEIVYIDIRPTKLQSVRRVTYAEVDSMLERERENVHPKDLSLYDSLSSLSSLSLLRKSLRTKNGAKIFRIPAAEIEMERQFEPPGTDLESPPTNLHSQTSAAYIHPILRVGIDIGEMEIRSSGRIVEEMMLAAGEAAARWAVYQQIPLIFRTQLDPVNYSTLTSSSLSPSDAVQQFGLNERLVQQFSRLYKGYAGERPEIIPRDGCDGSTFRMFREMYGDYMRIMDGDSSRRLGEIEREWEKEGERERERESEEEEEEEESGGEDGDKEMDVKQEVSPPKYPPIQGPDISSDFPSGGIDIPPRPWYRPYRERERERSGERERDAEVVDEWEGTESLPILQHQISEALWIFPHQIYADYLSILKLQRAMYTETFGPHPGAGLAVYAHVTSPLRRFVDFINHCQIKSGICGMFAKAMTSRNALDEMSTKYMSIRTGKEWMDWIENIPGELLKGEEPYIPLRTHFPPSAHSSLLSLSLSSLSPYISLSNSLSLSAKYIEIDTRKFWTARAIEEGIIARQRAYTVLVLDAAFNEGIPGAEVLVLDLGIRWRIDTGIYGSGDLWVPGDLYRCRIKEISSFSDKIVLEKLET